MAWIMVSGVARMAACLATAESAVAEDEDVAGGGGARVDLDEVAARGFEQRLRARRLGPVAGVGGGGLGVAAVELAPDAADQADAVGADAA